MRPKSFVDKVHADHLWAHRADFDHRVDGVIVHVNTDVYGTGTYKWKEHSTVDLYVGDVDLAASSTYQYHTRDGPVPEQILSRKVEFTPSCVHYTTGHVVEFLVTVEVTSIRFFAVRIRPDKTYANSSYVVNATIQDVIDDVRVNEL